MTHARKHLLAWTASSVLSAMTGVSAPFEKTVSFVQPDGTAIRLNGHGDEFHAVFETPDGYTAVFVPAEKTYRYAALSADGTDLTASTLQVGRDDPAAADLAKHLRASPETLRAQAARRFARWDAVTRNSARWIARKEAVSAAEEATHAVSPLSPPSYATVGTKVGLCLLVDFSDDTNTIPQAEIIDFCNGDQYSGFGNNGSVKKYFEDNSNGLLIYTNIVTAYIRMVQPKSYYNDTSKDEGLQANLLIRDAVAILKTLPNYTTELAPAFSRLTLNGDGCVQVCNVFFAGDDSGAWSYGLWPHAWALYTVGAQTIADGIQIYPYQLSNIGNALELGTFCHENGHLLCGYPDLYDYGYDSEGGAGSFCLMSFGNFANNPAQICAYLKRASGWATTIDLTAESSLTAGVSASGAGFNTFYRFAKPGVSTEYFLIENRQQTGHDADLPAAGIAIWHIDELGDRDNQSLAYNTTHANYEAALVQADNQWQFQYNVNKGDAQDLYYDGNPAAGYRNGFNDATGPCARWWDGTASGIHFSAFSANNAAMTFLVQPPCLTVETAASLPDATIGLACSRTLAAYGGLEPYVWTLVSNALPSGLSLNSGGTLSGTPAATGTSVFGVRVTDATNGVAETVLSLTVNPPRSVPFAETFENGGQLPDGWTQEYVTNKMSWAGADGGLRGYPSGAHGGDYNARFAIENASSPATKLISPLIDFGTATQNAQLGFWLCMKAWEGDQDQLRVYYRTIAGAWVLLADCTNEVSAWTRQTVTLPETGSPCFIAFEGTAKYGYGVCLDDVAITAMTPYAVWQTNRFTEAEIAAGEITGDSDDPDGDGIVNVLEYAFGLDPKQADSEGFPGGGIGDGYLELSYRRNKLADDLLYEVNACTNLLDGSWSTNGVSERSRADSNAWWQVTARHTVPVTNAPARFMRLNITPR